MRTFQKETSLFRNWRMDTPEDLEICAELDFKYWKVPRICKDESDLKLCEEYVIKYYSPLKEIYITLISDDEYPNIGWMPFVNFCKTCQIVDKVCNMSVVDRAFIATNVELEDMDENPDRALQRFEFIEILFRLAAAKYKDTKKVSTFHEAFEKLVHENIFKHFVPEPWQSFREE